jgi:hypothetical protein
MLDVPGHATQDLVPGPTIFLFDLLQLEASIELAQRSDSNIYIFKNFTVLLSFLT